MMMGDKVIGKVIIRAGRRAPEKGQQAKRSGCSGGIGWFATIAGDGRFWLEVIALCRRRRESLRTDRNQGQGDSSEPAGGQIVN
jgi:hypothetical protein